MQGIDKETSCSPSFLDLAMAGSRGTVYMEEKAQDGMVAAHGILEADSCRFFAISFLPAPPYQDKRLHGASGSF